MNNSDSNDDMVFGLDRENDERSLRLLMQRVTGQKLFDELLPRLSGEEIDSIVDLFTGLMKKHFSKKEYHRLFLDDQ